MNIESFNGSTGEATVTLGLPELKRIYRALLYSMRRADGSIEDDGDVALKLQTFLQRQAMSGGVDVTEHAAWERWLGEANPVPCEQRPASFLKGKAAPRSFS